MSEYVMGIDMGAKNFGLAIICDDYSLVYTELLVINDSCIIHKSTELLQALERLGNEHNLTAIGYEFSVMRNKVGRTIDILSGIVLSYCIKANTKVYPIAVATCKKNLTGDRHADKSLVKSIVCEHLGINALNKTHHEVDAIAIALCTLQKINNQS